MEACEDHGRIANARAASTSTTKIEKLGKSSFRDEAAYSGRQLQTGSKKEKSSRSG